MSELVGPPELVNVEEKEGEPGYGSGGTDHDHGSGYGKVEGAGGVQGEGQA